VSDSLGSLAVLAVLFFAYFIVSFLGWWLLVIVPTLYCVVFFFRKREILRAAFSSSSHAPATDKDRLSVRVRFFILALVFTGLAIVQEGAIYPAFAASLCWLATLFVTKTQMEAADATKHFAYYLAKASVELATIVAATLAACSIFAFRVSMLPLDAATLFQIRSWEDQIAWIHDFFKSFSPTKVQTIVLIAVLYAGRIFEIRYGRGSTTIVRGWKATQSALKWADRLALMTLIAASFTFLATSSNGPVAPLEARLKDMEKSYSQFRGETEKAMVVETKRQLTQRAWHEMPPSLRQRMSQVREIQKDRESLLQEIRWADDEYHLDGTHSAKTEEEYAAQLERTSDHAQLQEQTPGRGENAHDAEADSATGGELRDAATDASNARAEIQKESLDTTNEMGEELTKHVQEFVDDFDRLTDNVGPLKLITDRYPLLGELLGPVNDAFNDYVYDKLKPSVQRLVREKFAAPKKPLSSEIKKESAELAQGSPLPWHSNEPDWTLELDRKLAAERSGIGRARRQLEADARFAEKREIRKVADEIRRRESEYRKIAEQMPEHKELLSEREEIDAELKRLEGLPPDPNPLAGFNRPARLTSQTEPTLDQLGSDLSLERQTEYNFRRLFDQTTTFVGTGHRDSLKRDIAIPQTVLEQFAYLDNRCASRIRKIVGAAEYGEGRSKVLAALGQPAFEEYSQQIEAERFGSETLNPWGALGSRRFPGELGPGLHDPLLEPRVEPKIEPRIEPHVEFVP